VGCNRRYADAIDHRMAAQADEIVMRDFEPVSLTKQELDLATQPLTRTPVPIGVKAWVHYRTIAVRVDAELVAWTPRACAIRWETPAGVEHRAWVWANAVDKL
jgi:hypothetical protein